MKKITAVLLTVIMLACAVPVKAGAAGIYILRVGLKETTGSVTDSVKISTKKIAAGYCIGNHFYEYLHFTSSSGFTFSVADGYYVSTEKVYTTYKSVNNLYKKARKVNGAGNHVYIAMLGKNKWKLYAGGTDSISDAESYRSRLSSSLNVDFGSVTSNNGQRVLITGGDSGVIYDAADTGQYVQIAANCLNSSGTKTLTVGSRQYRGRLEIAPYGGKTLTVVNILNVENYLRGVVGTVMNVNAPTAALKAQAMVSRTYAQFHAANSGDTSINQPYQIDDTETYQRYGGYNYEYPAAVSAVTSTRGKCIYYGGDLIDAQFFRDSGGATESASELLGQDRPYLRSVSDVTENSPGQTPWVVTMTAAELGEKLSVGECTSVTADRVSSSGRVVAMTVQGTGGKRTLLGINVYKRLDLPGGKFKIISKTPEEPETWAVDAAGNVSQVSLDASWTVGRNGLSSLPGSISQYIIAGRFNMDHFLTKREVGPGTYVFAGMGSGSGLGMSQSGAVSLAQMGYSGEEIIDHYYGNSVSVK